MSRTAFEDAVYLEYFTRGVKFIPTKQFAEVRNRKPKAELLARDKDDAEHYADKHIDAMWFGWKLCCEWVDEGHD